MINLANLAAKLKENIADYSTIYLQRLANGFDIRQDPLFTVIRGRDQVPLVRDFTASILQPGRTGTVNFTANAFGLRNRMAQLRPFKADLQLSEQTIYSWSKLYGANRKPTDPTDIYSFPAMDFYMGRILARAGRDILSVLFNGVYNSSGTALADIADGLKIHFTQGVATSGTGFVGDIPAGNVITAATTIDQTNVLSEINKFVLVMAADPDFPSDEPATLSLDPVTFVHMVNASNSALTNGAAIVTQVGGVWRLSAFPNTVIEAKKWLGTGGRMMWTIHGNLVMITPETDKDIPSIQVENSNRNIAIFLDGEVAYNYIDGRYILLNTKVTA